MRYYKYNENDLAMLKKTFELVDYCTFIDVCFAFVTRGIVKLLEDRQRESRTKPHGNFPAAFCYLTEEEHVYIFKIFETMFFVIKVDSIKAGSPEQKFYYYANQIALKIKAKGVAFKS